jgi:hypothetical protein
MRRCQNQTFDCIDENSLLLFVIGKMMEESIAAKERYQFSGAENTESWFVIVARAPDDQLAAHYLEYAWVTVWPSPPLLPGDRRLSILAPRVHNKKL